MHALPFNLFPETTLKAWSKRWETTGEKLSKGFPKLKLELNQAGFEYSEKEYLGIGIALFIVYALALSLIFTVTLLAVGSPYFLLGLGAGVILGFLVFMQIILYPKLLIQRKVREMDQNLIYAVRTLLIQIKSGVSLFHAMNIVAQENYGVLSQEFAKAIRKINSGVNQEDALQEMVLDNPSPTLRKIIWQIINGLKGGAELADVLQESMNSMVRDQLIDIRKYGSQLRMDSLIYMMIGVIIPALGLTFLIVLGSVPQIQITESIFWTLLGVVIVMNYFFLGIMKSKRPALL